MSLCLNRKKGMPNISLQYPARFVSQHSLAVYVSFYLVLSTAEEEKKTDVAYLRPESKPSASLVVTQVPGVVVKLNMEEWIHFVTA